MANPNLRNQTAKRTAKKPAAPKATAPAATPNPEAERNSLCARIYRLQAAACEAGTPYPAFGGAVITQLLQGEPGELSAEDLDYLLSIGVTLQDVATCGPRLALHA